LAQESEINKTGANVSEEQWVTRAVSGDSEAFAQLYTAYVDQIYRFIFFKVSDHETAEDLTSQVFLKVWQSLGNYRKRELHFGAWLFQVARNTVIDHYRTQRKTESLETAIATRPDPEANVKQIVDRRLTREWLWSKLDRLTEDQREVIILKFIEGLSTREAAEIMDKQQGAIRALQMRALQALADMVESDGS
jgi:RNA polymerase sigma-70 factor, ECF subfamily